MIYKYDAAIIGGDLRQVYLALIIAQSGYSACTFGLNESFSNSNIIAAESIKEALEASSIIIAPTPFSKDKKHISGIGEATEDGCKLSIESFLNGLRTGQYLIGGNIPAASVEILNEKHISCLDLMKDGDIALLNAIATAEGAIAEAIFKSRVNLQHSRALVLGYGRCGRVLASKLHAMGARVTVCARKKSSLIEAYTNCFDTMELYGDKTEISGFEFIFNTIPALVLTEELLSGLSSDTTIIDISSAPGGIDYDAARKLNLNAQLCLGIPGKIAPKSSAEILAKAILPILKERSD